MNPNERPFYGLTISEFITWALKEDVGDGDHTSLGCLDECLKGIAIVTMKEEGIVAGLTLAGQILNHVDHALVVETMIPEGAAVKRGDILMKVEGKIQSILKAERLLLNCMQRMSGIATLTRKMVEKIAGTNTKILDTRKTTPNFRRFEKWAVRIGGGYNHRFGLYDMMLIKNNHVDACGGITPAIKKANKYLKEKNKNLEIEIETRNLDEVKEVLAYGNVHRIMLDNFSPDRLKDAVGLINKKYETEASGGITFENIIEFAASGVDCISVGALTHSYKSLDINLKIIS